VIKLNNPISYMNAGALSQVGGQANQADLTKAAGQVEEVFLNELLKTMFQNTELSKGKEISGFLPYITAEISKSLSQKGIGIKEFFMKGPAFDNMLQKGQLNSAGLAQQADGAIQTMAIRAYSTQSAN
jgi:Rod binding domain-containing protein